MRVNFLMWLFTWSGTRLFQNVHVYCQKDTPETVEAVTFSQSKEYIEKVGEIEL